MKIKKLKKAKKFQFDRNRKRVFKNRQSTGKIKVNEVKEYWNDKRPVSTNARDMGLATDPNKSIPVPNFKQERLKIVKVVIGDKLDDEVEEEPKKERKPRKAFVAEQLEEDAKTPRISQLRLPKGHIKELEYFMDKYKLDYNSMVRDRKNIYQYTAKQFRSKIKKYMSIPEQFNEYLTRKNIKLDEFDWKDEPCIEDD